VTPEAWTFFTTDSLALITIMGQQVANRAKLRQTRARMEKVVRNTEKVGNGFVDTQASNFATLLAIVNRLDGKFDTMDEKLDAHIAQGEEIIRINSLKRDVGS